MSAPSPGKPSRNSDSFLLEEYKAVSDSFWRNEEAGERRVNFLISLVTAVIAALVTLAKSDAGVLQPQGVYLVAVYALGALLLFGIVTLMRIIHRNRVTDEYKKVLTRIRDQFRDDDRLRDYDPFPSRPRALFRGGLVEITGLINSLLVAALWALIPFPVSSHIIGRALAGLLASLLMHGLIIWRISKTKKQPRVNAMESGRTPHERETELALLICSDDAESLARQIASLTAIADYRLLPQSLDSLRDWYFDTPDQALQARRLALRLRESGASHWLTLKGPSQPAGWGAAARLEIEAPWSTEALHRVIQELRGYGLSLGDSPDDDDFAHPANVLTRLGLKIVQDRENHRQVRDVIHISDESRSRLAELTIDTVVYHFGRRIVRLQEVEIEAKVGDGTAVFKALTENLLATYGPALRLWSYGKLATGRAIEALLSTRTFEGLIDSNHNLKLPAYDKLDEYLRHEA